MQSKLMGVHHDTCVAAAAAVQVFEKLGPSLYDYLRRNEYQPLPLGLVQVRGRGVCWLTLRPVLNGDREYCPHGAPPCCAPMLHPHVAPNTNC